MADTMITSDGRSLSERFLTEAELMEKCPLAFKVEPTNHGVSSKYVQATTIDVVRDMAKLNWFPVQAKQCRAKRGSKGIRSFHMISFQNPDIRVKNGDETEAYPQIILTNSHDGFNSFKFMVGLFRLVCSNGLILADAEYANLSIRHINYTMDEFRAMINNVLEVLPNKIEALNDMKATTLTVEQQMEFAENAIRAKKGIQNGEKFNITKDEIMGILEPVRDEDDGNSLWATFNVIQEKLIKGGYTLFNGKKDRKQRGITSIKKDIEINSKLYELANSYVSQRVSA